MNFFAIQLLAAKNERKADLAKIVALQVKLQDCIAHIGSVDHVAVGQRNTRKQKKKTKYHIGVWGMGIYSSFGIAYKMSYKYMIPLDPSQISTDEKNIMVPGSSCKY